MTAFTPKMLLPYPEGTDKPCDGGQQLIDLRDGIYDHLDTFTNTLNRQKDPPMVSVAWIGGSQIVPTAIPVVFNAVEQDDIRAADLIALPNRITFGRPGFEGVYLCGFMAIVTTATDAFYMNLSGDTLTSSRPFDQATGSWAQHPPPQQTPPVMCGSSLVLAQGPVNATLTHISGTRTLTFARMWAVRIGSI